MKKYNQFITQTNELDEGLGTLAKVAVKGAVKLAKKGGLKKVGKFLKKKPRRTIDPFFADKAVERGTMVRGFHGQSAKNIAQDSLKIASGLCIYTNDSISVIEIV